MSPLSKPLDSILLFVCMEIGALGRKKPLISPQYGAAFTDLFYDPKFQFDYINSLFPLPPI